MSKRLIRISTIVTIAFAIMICGYCTSYAGDSEQQLATTQTFSIESTDGVTTVMPADCNMMIHIGIDNSESNHNYKITNVTSNEEFQLGKRGISVPNNGYYFKTEQEAQDYFFTTCLQFGDNKIGARNFNINAELAKHNNEIKAGEHLDIYIPIRIAGYETGNTYQGCGFDYIYALTLKDMGVDIVDKPTTDEPKKDTTTIEKEKAPKATTTTTNKNDIPQTSDTISGREFAINIIVLALCIVVIGMVVRYNRNHRL
jgi:hypothetical protein